MKKNFKLTIVCHDNALTGKNIWQVPNLYYMWGTCHNCFLCYALLIFPCQALCMSCFYARMRTAYLYVR